MPKIEKSDDELMVRLRFWWEWVPRCYEYDFTPKRIGTALVDVYADIDDTGYGYEVSLYWWNEGNGTSDYNRALSFGFIDEYVEYMGGTDDNEDGPTIFITKIEPVALWDRRSWNETEGWDEVGHNWREVTHGIRFALKAEGADPEPFEDMVRTVNANYRRRYWYDAWTEMQPSPHVKSPHSKELPEPMSINDILRGLATCDETLATLDPEARPKLQELIEGMKAAGMEPIIVLT